MGRVQVMIVEACLYARPLHQISKGKNGLGNFASHPVCTAEIAKPGWPLACSPCGLGQGAWWLQGNSVTMSPSSSQPEKLMVILDPKLGLSGE